MSGSGRKRSSKWDLEEEHHHSLENARDSALPRAGMSFHQRKSERGLFSPEAAGRNGEKWSVMEANDVLKSRHGLPSREPLPGSKSSHKGDSISADCVKNWKAMTSWNGDGDESYGMKMSPGLDDWREQNRHHSPKNDWNRSRRSRSKSWSKSRSRSRSRSPIRGFRGQSGFHERGRSRSALPTQLCKEFAAGRCRRGSQCQFLHQNMQNHEDGWDNRHRKAGTSKYSGPYDSKEYPMKSERSTNCCSDYLKGNCWRGASCRFIHDGTSDGYGKGLEVTRERESEMRNRQASPERSGEREPRRSSDIPCKFFAAGHCRNGKHCRFSHHDQARASPERKSHSDRRGRGHNTINVDKMLDDPRRSDREASNDVEKSLNGPKWSDVDAYSKTSKFTEEENEKIGNSRPRMSGWSIDKRWVDVNGGVSEPKVVLRTVEADKKESHQMEMESSAVGVAVSQQRSTEESLVDMEMSPEWNYRIQPSSNAVKREFGHISYGLKSHTPDNTTLPKHQQDIAKEVSNQKHDGVAILQPLTEKSYFQEDHIRREGGAIALACDNKTAIESSAISNFDLNFSTSVLPVQSFDQNAPSSGTLPFSSLHAVGRSQVSIPSDSNRGIMEVPQNQTLFEDGKSSNKANIGDTNTSQVNSGAPSTQNMVRNEQLSQLTNLSASLAQLLGNGQQLPQLYAALNPHDAMQVPSFTNSGGTVEPDSSVTAQPNQHVAPQKQYDPISDSIEPKNQDMEALGSSVNPVGKEVIVGGKPEGPSNNLLSSSLLSRPNASDQDNDQSSEKEPYLEPVSKSDATVANMKEGVEGKKANEEDKSGPLENTDADGRPDESKKSKDGKGNRAFKFALAEFVKNLLKPTWKEGQISKDGYKNIVKKVVDKVTATMQGTNSIPQTQEKIDQYLSFSKTKISKLVQAYVEKFQKG